MCAVSVSRLDQQDIGIFYDRWVPQYRASRLAEIAAEYEFPGIAVLGDPDFDNGGAQDVTRIAVTAANAAPGREVLVVVDDAHLT